jgi:hypothetical protein
MVNINGIFECIGIKKIGSKELLTLCNGDNDKYGNFIKAYYQVWIDDRVLKLLNRELRDRIKNKGIIKIKGTLKIIQNDKFLNLTIYPISIV